MKYISLLLIVLLTGCSTSKFYLQELCPDGTVRTTEINVRNYFDSKSELAKLKTTFTEKTQGVSVGSLSQESSATNAVSLAEAIASGVAKAFIGIK